MPLLPQIPFSILSGFFPPSLQAALNSSRGAAYPNPLNPEP